MNTLKTVVVVAVLAIVGYGLYIGLNNGFQFQNGQTETPDWIADQIGPPPEAPGVEFGAPGAPDVNSEASVAPGGFQPPQTFYPSATYPQPGTSPGAPGQVSPGAVGVAPGASPGMPDATRFPPADNTGGYPLANTNVTPPGGASAAPSPSLGAAVPPASGSEATADYRSQPTVPIADYRNQPTAPSTRPSDGPSTNSAFDAAISSARAQLRQGQLATALLTLSIWYEDPRLKPAQSATLTELLDQVAGTVIYSRKHLIERSYRVRPGERLSDIAANYKVPPGLLAKINGIAEPDALKPGQELKVIRGPFNAVINSNKNELTLFLGGRYAGRFAVTLGPEFEQIVGPFVVQDKTRAHSAHDNQPWIALGPGFGGTPATGTGQQLGIAGVENPSAAVSAARPGRISVSSRDASDLFDILTQGSKVTIRR